MNETIRHRLTRIHLWIGEALRLTRYNNCWNCKHVVDAFERPELCGCGKYEGEHGCIAITDPSEAVWCDDFERKANE